MKKILFVEDDEAIRFLVACYSFWKDFDFQITGEASNGEEALCMMDGNSFDVILTDIRMPKMDGLQMVTKLREKGSKIHAVIASTYSDFRYAKQAMRLGVLDFIEKPLTEEKLLESLNLVREALEFEENTSDTDYTASDFYESRLSEAPDMERERIRKEYQAIRENQMVLETCTFFLSHFKSSTAIEEVSQSLGMNRDYLSRRFKQTTGYTPLEYLTAVRMEYAKKRLKNRTLKIYEISGELGYLTPDHFSRVFKKYTGMTPNGYRRL
ncbi:response regulator transcription factor [Anaerostipes sp.]|uniref:response regulator transcription factor n=1 Tax=Anaerostipes sp. TaxID=1872530 RepID=UPI0025C23402|nr:response regulator [Anaerostipes sp.]MBS7007313.1 response regulator [Anaerostipes sp.]